MPPYVGVQNGPTVLNILAPVNNLIFPLLFLLVILDVSSECQTATFTINGNTGKYNFYFIRDVVRFSNPGVLAVMWRA